MRPPRLGCLAMAALLGCGGAANPPAPPARSEPAAPAVAPTAAAATPAPAVVRPPEPVGNLLVRVEAVYPHDPRAYTQGLLWYQGRLYESTGEYGASTLREVDLTSGEPLRRVALPANVFGEGLALVGERLYQLSWREGRLLLWNRSDFASLGELSYAGDGWGLCFNGRELVSTDGSAALTFHRPEDYQPIRRVEVRRDGLFVRWLNELECVGEHDIYANVYQTDEILRIDARTGEVRATIDATGLLSREERAKTDVLNGIAYRAETGTFLITGKNWPKLFEVTFVAP